MLVMGNIIIPASVPLGHTRILIPVSSFNIVIDLRYLFPLINACLVVDNVY